MADAGDHAGTHLTLAPLEAPRCCDDSLRLPTIQASWRAVGAVLTLAAALILGTIPAPALAHHGWSGYDSAPSSP